MAAIVATVQTNGALCFNSTVGRVNGKANSKTPVTLFITVCGVMIFFFTTHPDTMLIILISAMPPV